jgi:hypothetical protein
MQDLITKMHAMDSKSLENWILDNMDQDDDIASDFNDMMANAESFMEEAEADDTIYTGEVEERHEWALRYFFHMLNGVEEEYARDMAELR